MASRTPSTPPALPGYRPVRVLGTGGFADVFLYEQELPRRQVAVKVLLASELTPGARAAFTTEANLMAALSTHPYIVTIHDAGLAPDGRPFLVMEYCSRPGLAERYKAQPLSVPDAVRTGIRLASAVATAHGAGILHRDVKPGNVLTNDYGWPALTDFGIASTLGASGAPPTEDGADADASIGLSVPWSPPEMFDDVPEPDVRSDVFSLAATVHTVLAGRSPFEVRGGPNGAVELMDRIERGDLTPLERPDVPRSLIAALERGMAPRREDRQPSAAEFARALQAVELELGYAPTEIEVPRVEAPAVIPAATDDAPATRARGVATVATPSGAVPRGRTAGAGRGASSGRAVPPTGAASPTDGAPRLPRGERPPRRTLIAALVGALAVLTVLAVGLVVLLGTRTSPEAASEPTGDGGPALVGSAVPAPVDGVAVPSADGTAVEFRWTNPDPADGDVYYWARSESPEKRTVVDDPVAVVDGIVPGSRVCVDVETGRAGRTSAPLTICTD